MRYRVIVQRTESNEFKHEKSWTFDTDNIQQIMQRLQEATITEREKALERFALHLAEKELSDIKKIFSETPRDALPIQDKGFDIGDEEFLENEIDLIRRT